MKLRDFQIGWRLLVQEPAYSAVVVLGLAIGFAACFLLLGYVRHSLSYNAHVPDSEHVYVIKTRHHFPGLPPRWDQGVSRAAREALIASGLPLQLSSTIGSTASVRVGETVQVLDVMVVDPEFPAIFGIRPIAGDVQAAVTRPDALALTEEGARRLFGTTDVVGKTALVSGKPFTISALLPDPPAASTVPYLALAGVNASVLYPPELKEQTTTNWASSNGGMVLKLGAGTEPATVLRTLHEALERSAWHQKALAHTRALAQGERLIEFKLGALRETYFDPDLYYAGSVTHGNRQAVFGLAMIGVLILLLAATNYVNLATVRTLRRQREIGVRKVLGASVGRVAGQFLAESVLVSCVATAVGLLLAWLLLPLFSDLVNRRLDDMFSPLAFAASAALATVVGLASGAYPAWVATHVRATQALSGRGNSETRGGLWLRRVLTVLQFATAMGLTALTLAIVWQTHYATQLDPGFDPAPLLVLDAPDDMRVPAVHAFRDALARLPGVAGVAATTNPVGRNFNTNNVNLLRPGHEETNINSQAVSPEFFEVYNLRPLAGRLFSGKSDRLEDGSLGVINAAAVNALGFETPEAAVGQFVMRGGRQMQIIGVVGNIRHRSLRELPRPVLYELSPRIAVLNVRVSGDPAAVKADIEALWRRHFPNDVFDISPARSFIEQQYADDLRIAKLLLAAAVVAIAIAAFGIYVLSAYSVQRRAKEIVLRKLYGADQRAIGKLLAMEFMTLIAVGAVIGIPIAAVAMQRYLATYVERAPIGAWTLLFAVVVAAIVACASTLRHTLAAMRIAPALALRQ